MREPTAGVALAPKPCDWPGWLERDAGAAARARMKAHPGFETAMLAAARSTVDLYDNHPLLNRILNDRGRTVFGFLILYLDAASDGAGITTARMAALCHEEGVCSRGRTKALLALMRWGGYLAPVHGTGDRRERPLAATPRMWDMFRRRWRQHFEAMRALGGAADDSVAAVDDPDFCRTLARTFGHTFRSGYRVLDHAPAVAPFADRDGGMMIFFALLVAARAGAAPPAVAELARRFHLSRAHVLQILKDAAAAGLVGRAGERETAGFALSPAGEDGVADFFATSFALLDCSARQALSGGAPQDADAARGDEAP